MSGPLKQSTFMTYRVGKVTGCATWLANDLMEDFAVLKAKAKKAGKTGKDWQSFERKLDLMHKGMKHELAMCQFVEDNGYGFIKRFESHERVPKDYRRRADLVSTDYKKEQQAAKKAKNDSSKKKSNVQKGPPKNKNRPGCWNCDALGHHSKECPHPQGYRNMRNNS